MKKRIHVTLHYILHFTTNKIKVWEIV